MAAAASSDRVPPLGRAHEDLKSSFKDLMSSFPSGVAVITAIGPGSPAMGFTCSSLCSVTLEPPTLLLCAQNNSGTLAVIRATGVFGVNLLHERAERAAVILASGTVNRLRHVRWEPSEIWGLPYLVKDAHGFAECALVDTMVVGSHTVLLGEIAGITTTRDTPLLYGFRQFMPWGQCGN